MIPLKKIEDLITKHSELERDLSSGKIDKKFFAEKIDSVFNLLETEFHKNHNRVEYFKLTDNNITNTIKTHLFRLYLYKKYYKKFYILRSSLA